MPDKFRTISAPSSAVFTDKRSKFLAFAFPVNSVEEVKTILADLSKKYFDARHICYAYMLGPERNTFRANDNGEPSGTAGKPILGQINSFELTDILVAVVRYFGGIKLGTSGLIVAYRSAAALAISDSQIVERYVTVPVSFSFPYSAMNDVMKLTRDPNVEMLESVFDNTCSLTLRVRISAFDSLVARLSDIDGISIVNH